MAKQNKSELQELAEKMFIAQSSAIFGNVQQTLIYQKLAEEQKRQVYELIAEESYLFANAFLVEAKKQS